MKHDIIHMVLNGQKIYGLNELQKSFAETEFPIKDFMNFYEKGSLVKWLIQNRCVDEAEAIKGIEEGDKEEVFKKCIKILHVKVKESTIKDYFNPESSYIILKGKKIRSLNDLRKQCAETEFPIQEFMDNYKSGRLVKWLMRQNREIGSSIDGIKFNSNNDEEAFVKCTDKLNIVVNNSEIRKYFCSLEELVNDMKAHRSDFSLLIQDAIDLENMYYHEFCSNLDKTYFELKAFAPKALVAIMSRDILRDKWMSIDKIRSDIIYISWSPDVIKKLFTKSEVRIVDRNTYGQWETMEESGSRIMVLYISSDVRIKSSDDFDNNTEKTCWDVNSKFPKFNGLKYYSKNDSTELIYMKL